MILYQLAKNMEDRAELERTIRESGGDVSKLIEEKSRIEQAMLLQAMKWQSLDATEFV